MLRRRVFDYSLVSLFHLAMIYALCVVVSPWALLAYPALIIGAHAVGGAARGIHDGLRAKSAPSDEQSAKTEGDDGTV